MLTPSTTKPNLLTVLTYHRVAELSETPHLNLGLISATPAMFQEQMNILARHYNVVSMESALSAVAKCRALPERAVLITFDDAYLDFATHAWPILKNAGLPVTVFVPTAFPDQPERMFWWDKVHQSCKLTQRHELSTPIGPVSLRSSEERGAAIKRLQGHVKNLPHNEAMDFVDQLHAQTITEHKTEATVLDWDELRRLANEGVTLGAHTRTHPILTRVPLNIARSEIVESQADLKREIGDVLPIFSYPDGGHTQAVVDVLQKAGFELGFNGPSGVNDLNVADPFRIRRINVTRKTTAFIFRLRMSPLFSAVEKLRHRKRLQEISTSALH